MCEEMSKKPIIISVIVIIIMISACVLAYKFHPHQYKVVNIESTDCSKGGIATYKCWCGATYTDVIEPREHDYVESLIIEPECNREGRGFFVCKVCGDSYEESIPKAEHEYESEVLVEPTCKKEGIIFYSCKHCNHTYEDKIPTVDHKYIDGLSKEPMCTQEGYITHICEVCSERYTESLPALGHEYDEDGYCIRCGMPDATVVIEPTVIDPNEPSDLEYDFSDSSEVNLLELFSNNANTTIE